MANPWLSPAQVRPHLGGGPRVSANLDDATLQPYVDAAAAYVAERRPDASWTTDEEGLPVVAEWDGDLVLGAALVASRLLARRGTPLGVLEGTEGFSPAYVVRADPDVARLLGVGLHTPTHEVG